MFGEIWEKEWLERLRKRRRNSVVASSDGSIVLDDRTVGDSYSIEVSGEASDRVRLAGFGTRHEVIPLVVEGRYGTVS